MARRLAATPPPALERPANRWLVPERCRGWRLDRFLQERIPKLSRARIQEAIRSRVTLSWHPRPRPSLPVAPGGEVVIWFPAVSEPEVPSLPEVLHEDSEILVANKPAGLLVHPTHSCLKNNLVHLLRAGRPGLPLSLAHRLDRETSGLILLTKTTDAARSLAGQFERREIEKTYLAIVFGRPHPSEGTIDSPLGVEQRLQVVFRRSAAGRDAQKAVTGYNVLGTGAGVSLLLLSPRTGRRHQLRAHLAGIGHPIVGDRLYALSDRDYLRYLRGRLAEGARHSLLADRQFLHAFRLRFRHPGSGRRVCFEAPLPGDMVLFLEQRGIETRLPPR